MALQTDIYKKIRKIIPVTMAMLLGAIIIATAVGSVSVPFSQTVKIILKNWGIGQDASFPAGLESIIYYIRFPRVITAAIVGAALGISGAVMQGMFRNPMADPGILGVSSGASLGAVIAIGLGFTAKSMLLLPLFASTGAIIAAFAVFMFASGKGRLPVMNLILSGIAVSMFINAITTIILSVISGDRVKQFFFWTLGSLNTAVWQDAGIAAGPVIACIFVLLFFSRDLNVLLLGEEESQSVGLNPSVTRKLLLLFASVTTAAAVCVSGTISFVGLVVPHIIRLIAGPDHRLLLPASAIGGAFFLVVCDIIARVILPTGEVGVGIITSLIGAPYFLFLLNRKRKEGAII